MEIPVAWSMWRLALRVTLVDPGTMNPAAACRSRTLQFRQLMRRRNGRALCAHGKHSLRIAMRQMMLEPSAHSHKRDLKAVHESIDKPS